MKIGFFTDSYLPSPDGVATSVEASAQELMRLGHEVFVVAPNQPHGEDRKNVIRIVSVHIMKSPDVWWGLQIPQPALFKIAKLEFDIIHGHSGGPISVLGWQLARLHAIPFVETYHTSWEHYQHYFPLPSFFNVEMIKKLNRFFNNDCDAVITPSIKAKNELLREHIEKPIYVVPNGIFPEKFHHEKKGYLHKQLEIASDKKIILTVGRLHKEKSMDFLIRAFALVHKESSDYVFVIVGKGQKYEELKKLTTKLGVDQYVYFAGAVEYAVMPKVYADANLFLFASKTETQGLVVLEAMASSVPVVAVEDIVFTDVVENGKNGFLVKKDIDLFAKKILFILKNEPFFSAMRHNAKKTGEKFSVRLTTRILEQIYEEIIFTKNMGTSAEAKSILPEELEKLLSFTCIEKNISEEYTSFKELLTKLKTI